MGSIFIEIFDVKVVYAIYPIVYIYIYQGNTVRKLCFHLMIIFLLNLQTDITGNIFFYSSN